MPQRATVSVLGRFYRLAPYTGPAYRLLQRSGCRVRWALNGHGITLVVLLPIFVHFLTEFVQLRQVFGNEFNAIRLRQGASTVYEHLLYSIVRVTNLTMNLHNEVVYYNASV